MATEIERKFLVVNDNWRDEVDSSQYYIQGYFTTNKNCSIRIRISGDSASLNIKSATLGVTRTEFNYAIPLEEAREMLETLCNRPLLEKTRYFVRHEDHLWEIDEFTGDNEGLVVAEVELESADEEIALPAWAGKDVSDDPRYYNTCLAENPYKNWKDNP